LSSKIFIFLVWRSLRYLTSAKYTPLKIILRTQI
jgi:hypothetical protein